MSARTRIASLLLSLSFGLGGCVVIPNNPTDNTHSSFTAIPDPERVLLSVGPRVFLEDMALRVKHLDRRLQAVDGQAYIDAASPDAALTLDRLLAPQTRSRVESLQVDYVVLLGVPQNRVMSSHEGVNLGRDMIETGHSVNSTMYWAAVVDARELKLVEQMTSEAVGKEGRALAAGLIGVWMLSDTRGSARDDSLRHVVKTIARVRPSGPVRVAYLAVESIPTVAELAQAKQVLADNSMRSDLSDRPAFQPESPPAAGEALVYLYRTEDYDYQPSITMRMGEDPGAPQVVKLWPGGYYPVRVPAGAVTLATDEQVVRGPPVAVHLQAEPGATYFVKVALAWRGLRKSIGPQISVMDRESGLVVLSGSRLLLSASDHDAETRDRAERGHGGAQVELAALYVTGATYVSGEVLGRDGAEAYKWYLLASVRPVDFVTRELLISVRSVKFSAAEIEEGKRRADHWRSTQGVSPAPSWRDAPTIDSR